MGRELARLAAVATNTFRETVRQRVLYNLVFFALLMTLSGLLLARLSIGQEAKVIKDIGLAAMDLFGTVIAIFIGVELVSKEIERRSLYPLLAKPLTRTEFYLGKFAGLLFTLVVNLAVMTCGLFLTLAVTGSPVTLQLLAAVYSLLLGLALVVAFAMLFSTLTSSTLASVFTVGIVLAGRFADVVKNMREVAPGVPPWLSELLYGALPNFQHFDFKDRVAYGDPVPAAVLGWVTAYALGYVGVVLSLGLLSFRSRDFQ